MRARRDRQAGTGHRGGAPARWRGAAAAGVVVAAAALSLVAGAVPASAAGGYTVTATIPVGSYPDGVAVDPAAGTVYVPNSLYDTVSAIDEATNTVTAAIAVGAEPYGVAVDPVAGTVYVTNSGDGTVSVISADLPVPVTTMTSSQDPGTFGQKVTFTATTAPTDGGTITFTNGATVLCAAVPLTHAGGSTYKAKCATTTLPAGFNTITAAYPGDTRYAASADTLTQTVAQAPTALTASFRTAQKVLTLTAKLTASGTPVSGQPISFSTGTTPLCTPDTSTTGEATCTLTAAQTLLAEQDHDPILASYSGTASYQPSSATMTPP
jgi:YVTN family beta-propeller protein